MKTISKALTKQKVGKGALFLTLVSAAAILPAVIHQQAITGPIINTTLFLAAYYLSFELASMIALFPSLIALSVGLLPVALAPMVPFIMISNILLIWIFKKFSKTQKIGSMIGASALKFIFLYLTSFIVTNLIVKAEIAKKASLMMSWPQLLTAITGGFIALSIIKFTKFEK